MSRLREGRANTARGAAHFLRETVGRVRTPGPTDDSRYDSGFYTHGVVPSAARWMSASPSPSASTRACAISSRRYPLEFPTGWTAPPMWPRPPALPSRVNDAAPVRLIVRRVSYHGFITDRDGETLELEADHRPRRDRECHPRPQARCGVEPSPLGPLRRQRRLAGGGPQHRPLDSATLRRRFFSLAGRITRSACICHSAGLGKPSSIVPFPVTAAAATGRHPANRTSPRTQVRSASASCCVLSPLSRPDQHSQTVTKSPRGN